MFQRKKNIIKDNVSVRDAVKKMDIENSKLLIVINNLNKVIGIFTMGDFRRAIFYGLDIDDKISSITNKNFQYLAEGYSKRDAKKIFIDNNLIMDIPVLSKKHQLLTIVNRSSFFNKKKLIKKKINLNNLPVVIMAGGKGTRLDPFTRILPKPLIPIGNNPIIRVIMDNFINHGLKKFYISVNEKSSMIKSYFSDHKFKYKIKFIEEKKPLGTAGSLKLLTNKLKKTFIVTNTDIQVHSDYLSMIELHKKNNNDITLISSIQNYTIPYGVCTFDKDGILKNINEKPKYDFFINTGLYIIEPKILKLIPKNIKYDMSHLLNKALSKGIKIGIFPISERSWIDIGQWSEYKKNISKFRI